MKLAFSVDFTKYSLYFYEGGTIIMIVDTPPSQRSFPWRWRAINGEVWYCENSLAVPEKAEEEVQVAYSLYIAKLAVD